MSRKTTKTIKTVTLAACNQQQLRIIAKSMGLDEKRPSFAGFIYGEIGGRMLQDQIRFALTKMGVTGVNITNPKFLQPIIERQQAPSMKRLPVAVVVEATLTVVRRFATVTEAEAYIAEREKVEPDAVHAGKYGIDAPETMVNPPAPKLSGYAKIIWEATGVTSKKKLAEIEDCMRHVIFHSTLDWQTAAQLKSAARRAVKIIGV